MTAKEYLSQINDCNMRLKSIGWQIESLETALGCTSSAYSDTPKCATRNVHRMEDLIVEKLDLERKMKDLQSTLTAAYTTIREMSDPVHSAILSGRYVMGKEWHELCREIHISESRIFQIHRAALAELEKTVARCS